MHGCLQERNGPRNWRKEMHWGKILFLAIKVQLQQDLKQGRRFLNMSLSDPVLAYSGAPWTVYLKITGGGAFIFTLSTPSLLRTYTRAP